MDWRLAIGVPTLLAATVVAAGAAVDMPRLRTAQVNYALHCQGCHLQDGSGMPGKVPDMRGKLGLYAALPSGRAYIARVPGSANARISDEEKADLLNWLVVKMGPARSDFTPYTASEVAVFKHSWLKQPLLAKAALEAEMAREAKHSNPR